MVGIMKTNNCNTTSNNSNTKPATRKIANWSSYNRSLVQRGNLSVYVSEAMANKAFLKPKKDHRNGHPLEYSNDLILLMLTIRELFRLPLRQTAGFVSGLLQSMKLDWPLPDYSTVSRRMGKLQVDFCHKFHGQNIVLLLDSSGFKVFGEGEWKVRKHGYSYRRTWRETHIAIDYQSRDIVGLINTKSGVHDNTQLRPLLKQVRTRIGSCNTWLGSNGRPGQQTAGNGPKIATIIGDGAYDAKDNYLLAKKLSLEEGSTMTFIAPPPKNATINVSGSRRNGIYDTPGWEERNDIVLRIDDIGTDKWKQEVGYHRRSLVENAFYRMKTIFGSNLKSRKTTTQYAEQCLRASLINRFNQLGLPSYC